MFEGFPPAWDIHKLQLVYWLHRYDSIREAYNAPPESIISDNEAIDEWLKEQGNKIEEERRKEYYKQTDIKSASQHDYVVEIMGKESPFGGKQD